MSDQSAKRDTYRYEFRNGRRVLHRGITNDLAKRESEHRRDYGGGRIVQQGPPVTRAAALEWERQGGPPVARDRPLAWERGDTGNHPAGSQLLKKMRASANLSQRDMAEALGFSVNTVSQYERGLRGVKLELLQAWADICGWRIEAFPGAEAEERRLSITLAGLPPWKRALINSIIENAPHQNRQILEVVSAMLKLNRIDSPK